MNHGAKLSTGIRPSSQCRSFLNVLAAFLIVSGLGPDVALGADNPEPPLSPETGVKPIRPWQLVIGIGRRNDNGRWDDLVGGLEAGGFDDGQCEGWMGPCPYPKGGALTGIVHLALARDFGAKFGIRLFYNTGDYVEGTGFNGNYTIQVNYLDVKSELSTVGMLAEFVPTRAIRLGLGPSLNTLDTTASTQDYEGKVLESFHTTSEVVGLVLSLSANLPPDHPLFVHLAIRRHIIAGQEIGPFDSMPATSIEMSHTSLVLALGLSI